MSVIVCLFLVFLILIAVKLKPEKKTKHTVFYKHIGAPPGLPLLGHALDIISPTKLIPALQNFIQKYGDTVKLDIGPVRTFLVTTDYRFLEFTLGSTVLLKKSADYEFLKPWLGTGLLTSDGTKWKKHRKILTPAFHFQILEQFIDIFESCGDVLVNKLKGCISKSSIDICPHVTLCSLDIICESTMGIKINAQTNEKSDYVYAVKNMSRIAIERSLSPIQMYDFLFRLSKNYYTQKQVLRILHDQAYKVITNKVEELKSKSQPKSRKKKAFLDILLEATVDGNPLTKEQIREEVDTFMFEGHDTVSSAIGFALFCLANHAEIQEKVLEEQNMILDKNSIVKYADLQNMKYLEQVIKEVLRLYPPVPIYAREIIEDVTYNGITLPKGDTISIFAYGMHRNPKYFQDPEKFNPDRFNDIDGKLPYAYIPFSAGPRNCIGQKFAMLEMKSVISKLVRHFELKPANPEHKLELSAELLLKSINGIKISLHSRQNLS